MTRRRQAQAYAREIRALRGARASLAMLEDLADRVQARQYRLISGKTAPAWDALSPKEREAWLQGVRLYLGAVVALGWRPPATKTKRPGHRVVRAA